MQFNFGFMCASFYVNMSDWSMPQPEIISFDLSKVLFKGNLRLSFKFSRCFLFHL